MKKVFLVFLMALFLSASGIETKAYSAGYDLNTVSTLTAEELAPYMHPKTRHLAEDVVRICAREGVSAEFIVTVMRWEHRVDLNNYFGWTDSNGLMRFSSGVECLETVIPRIKEFYLTEGGRYYNGATVAGVNVYYNGTEFWEETITDGMNDILSDF